MSEPDWFVLIKQWREQGMGEHGITLPFLIGALAEKSGRQKLSEEQVRDVLIEMIENPVTGYVMEIHWCAGISAPVLSVESADKPQGRMLYQSHFKRPNGEGVSVGFSPNLHYEYSGLGCKDEADCLDKLVTHAFGAISAGKYSRSRSEAGELVYTNFSESDLDFIKRAIIEPR